MVEFGEGGEETVGRPTITTPEGQQAMVSRGQSVDDGAGGNVSVGYEVAVSVRVVDGGNLRMDARVEMTSNKDAAKGELSVQGTSVRINRLIRLNEKIILEMTSPDSQGRRIRIRLSVSEAERKDSKKAG